MEYMFLKIMVQSVGRDMGYWVISKELFPEFISTIKKGKINPTNMRAVITSRR